MKTVYVDLDGVLVDLVQGVLNKEHITHYNWPEEKYNIEEVLGIKLTELSQEFWATLPMTSEAEEIMDLICNARNISTVALCSVPCGPACAAGKWQWWKASKFAGFPLILISWKYVLNKWDTFLVDDSDVECTMFRQSGPGNSFLVPRPWNSWHGMDVMVSLREYFK